MSFDASEILVSLPVSTDLHTSQFCCVTVNSSGQLALTTAGAAADGVLLSNDANAQGKVAGMAISGITKVVLATGGCTAGDLLMVSGSAGQVTTQTSTNKIIGRALATGNAGDIIPMLLILQH